MSTLFGPYWHALGRGLAKVRSLGVQKQNRKHVYQQTYGSLTIFDRGIAKCSGLAPRCKIGTIPIKKFRSFKGQLILKELFAILEFFQKTNKKNQS